MNRWEEMIRKLDTDEARQFLGSLYGGGEEA